MQKAIIAMLTVMLVIIVVFTSFGIAYSKNDFVSTMIKVEDGLGDTSDKVMTTYKKTSDIINQIYTFLDSNINFSNTLERAYNSFIRFLSKVSSSVSLISRFGLNSNTRDSFSVLFHCFNNEQFWNDNDFDIEQILDVVGCLFYDEINEFTYFFFGETNSLYSYFNSMPSDTYYGIFSKVSYETASSLSFDDSYVWFKSINLRYEYENSPLSKYLPKSLFYVYAFLGHDFYISDTNIEYEFDDGCVIKPFAFYLTSSVDRSSMYERGLYTTKFIKIKLNSEFYYLNFVFDHTDHGDIEAFLRFDGGIVVDKIRRPDLYYYDNLSWSTFFKSLLNRDSYYCIIFTSSVSAPSGGGGHMGGRDF